jgi:hypothetical protein
MIGPGLGARGVEIALIDVLDGKWRLIAGYARGPAKRVERWVIFAVFFCLTALRLPEVFFAGRLWAEEGRWFYFYAIRHPWLASIFKPYGGYLNLCANIAGVIAYHLFPIDDAPRVTLVISLVFQLLPAILLLTSRAWWLRPRLNLAVALLLLVGAPSAEEAWLNTLHSQFFMALCVALILAIDVETGWRAIFHRGILFLAPLFGLPAVILFPLFALRTVLDRSAGRLIQSAILLFGSLLQLGIFDDFSGRNVLNVKLILATYFSKNILVPFLGYSRTNPFIDVILPALEQGHLPVFVPVSIVLFIAGFAFLFWRGPREAQWMAATSVFLAMISYFGVIEPTPVQIDPHIIGRYAFVPQILLSWALLCLAASQRSWRKIAAAGLIVWLLLVCTMSYLHPYPDYAHGPDWKGQMAILHEDPLYWPLIWPDGQWFIPVTRRMR